MLYKVLIASLFVSAIKCFTEQDYKTTFTAWMQEHQKTYTSDEFQMRYDAFKGTMSAVAACNHNENLTYTCGLNQFSDLSPAEFRKIYNGFVPDFSEWPAPHPYVELDPLPEHLRSGSGGDILNWADKGAVLPPKDQGQCGSCWAFSSTGALEALNHIYTGNLISLSEQNLIDCSGGYGNGGCGGGNPFRSFQYVAANHGIDTEASYPYETRNDNCRFNSANVGASCSGVTFVNQGDENDLVNKLNGQPVSVAMDARNLQYYSSGIFNDPSCSQTDLDHAVLLIGYGSNYYIIQNSWGTGWGMGGYFWLARGSNSCGIATSACVPNPGA